LIKEINMPITKKNRAPVATQVSERLTQPEVRQAMAARPDMTSPKATIDAAAWSQVNLIMKQRSIERTK
jgi:hypothetical protein